MKPIEVNDKNFEEIIKKYPLVVIDCWAEWCMPCIMIAPLIDELANDYIGKVLFGKINVDCNQKIPEKYGVMAIPTLLIFKNGHCVDRIVGAVSKKTIKAKINQYLE